MHSTYRRVFVALAAAMPLAFPGCVPTAQAPRSDAVVLIVIDTLRGDRVGYAGYAPAATPTLDSLAARGVVFSDAMTPAPVTLPAVASLLTGRLPFQHGVRDNDHCVLPGDETTLAERFGEAGWRTGAIVASAVLARDRGLDQGFEIYDDAFAGPYPVYTPDQEPLQEEFAATRRRADRVTDLALEAARGFGEDPYFLLVHYFDAHMHYDPPPAFRDMHPGRPYDGEASFVDHEIGRLLANLPRRERATVVVVADHGESQNEHGEPQHGFLVYQSTLHVPFLAVGPGIPAGVRRPDPVSLVDLEPTLAAWFGLDGTEPERAGRELVWTRVEQETAPLYAETFRPLLSYRWSPLRSLRQGEWKLIQGTANELYRPGDDPGELHPVVDPAVESQLVATLTEMTEGDDPRAVYAAAHGGADEERRELLESLGYVGGDAGHEPLPETLPDPKQALGEWLGAQESKRLLRMAGAAFDAEDFDRARSLVDSALVEDETLVEAWMLLGAIEAEAGRLGEAEKALRAAIHSGPTHVPALHALAALLELRGEEGDALDLWHRILELEPDYPEALGQIAEHRLEDDRPADALPLLRRLARVQPDNPKVQYNLGVAAGRAGLPREAMEHLDRFLEMEPDSPAAAEIKKLLH